MKNIHISPTNKPSRISILNSGKLDFGAEIMSSSNSKPQHIYITSDEEIKDVRPHKGKWQLEKGLILNKFPNYLTDLSECKLIILTTDQDLINDGVQAIDDEFLEWFVKNPSCEEVEVELKTKQLVKPYDVYNEIVSYYKIIIPKEEPKQEIQKLYTEEQVRESFKSGFRLAMETDGGLKEGQEKFIDSLTPIELPSDEEIDKFAFKKYHSVEDSRWFEPLQIGAKWMKQQILNQNK